MNIITYHIESDYNGMLRDAAKLSCDFWNRFVLPASSIVIRLGVFTQFGNTIARAYYPYKKDGVVYGVIQFNTYYLDQFTQVEIVGTIIHEVGHTLGFGWDEWMELFNHDTGLFTPEAVEEIAALGDMYVETDYGAGTTLAHWDEERHRKAMMSGFKSSAEYVLPVTIDIMTLLGHQVIEKLAEKTSLEAIIEELSMVQFMRMEDATQLDREAFVQTNIWEEIYSDRRTSFA
jgi:hypothetical protein